MKTLRIAFNKGEIRCWEQAIIAKLKSNNVRFAETEDLGAFDDYSESWYSSDLKTDSLSQLFQTLGIQLPSYSEPRKP